MSNVKLRGFGTMVKNDPEKLRKIAAAGGRKAQESGKAHKWNSEEASKAGRKGGKGRKVK